MTSIGIDLGTTNSAVSIFRNGDYDCLEFDDGKRVMRSVIAYRQNSIVAGNAATLDSYIGCSVKNVKRYMGLSYSEANNKHLLNMAGVKVDTNSKDEVLFSIKDKEVERITTPNEVSSEILKALMNTALSKIVDGTYNDICICVPANFTYLQREATLKAAEMAGIKNACLLNEPTAACLWYCHQNQNEKGIRYYIIYDFGGGTFDISIVKCEGKVFTVLYTDGDIMMGGINIDVALLEIAKLQIRDWYNRDEEEDLKYERFEESIDPSTPKGKRKYEKLVWLCQEAKIALSNKETVDLQLDGFRDLENARICLTREDLNEVTKNMVSETITIIDKAMKRVRDGNQVITMDSISKIILVGGSTRLLAVKEELRNKYGDKVCEGINPDECVSKGACLYARSKEYTMSEKKNDGFVVSDIVNHTYGVALIGNRMYPLIKKGERLPLVVSKEFTTTDDSQDSVETAVYEGEDPSTLNNTLIKYMNYPIAPGPAGSRRILFNFRMTISGTLEIDCQDLDDSRVLAKLRLSV